MKQKPCIIILAYPNTDNKIQILLKCLSSVKNLNIPIFVFSNMNIDKKYLDDANEFIYTGENKMVSASDFLSVHDITLARNTTKYRHHLTFDNNIITYIPITYGTEKSYYWALTKLYQKSFEYVYDKGFTHFMLLQYDTVLNGDSVGLVNDYLNELYSSDLDGIISVDPNMGNNHMNDYAFFGATKWWNELFLSTSAEEFYTITFPNWTIEEYYFTKCKNKEGNIKFKIRSNLEEWEKDYYHDTPSNWIKDIINSDTRESINLFFPSIKDAGLSNYWETPNFDIEKSLVVSIRPLNDLYQIFVWNKLISEQDKKIIVTISFPKINESDLDVDPIHLELLPGVWNIRDYQEQISGRKVVVEYSYEQDNDIVSDTKIYYI
jgi:hypothetical protein